MKRSAGLVWRKEGHRGEHVGYVGAIEPSKRPNLEDTLGYWPCIQATVWSRVKCVSGLLKVPH